MEVYTMDVVFTVAAITYQVELWNIMECVSLHGEPHCHVIMYIM